MYSIERWRWAWYPMLHPQDGLDSWCRAWAFALNFILLLLLILEWGLVLRCVRSGKNKEVRRSDQLWLIIPALVTAGSYILGQVIAGRDRDFNWHDFNRGLLHLHVIGIDVSLLIMARLLVRHRNVQLRTKRFQYFVWGYAAFDIVSLLINLFVIGYMFDLYYDDFSFSRQYVFMRCFYNPWFFTHLIFCYFLSISIFIVLIKTRRRRVQPHMQPMQAQSSVQPVQVQEAPQSAPQPAGSVVNIQGAVSLRDEEGGSAVCFACGNSLTGFGRYGGFCSSCKEWDYDRGVYLLRRMKYGPSAESLFILAAYENVRYRSESGDYPGKLYVMPGSLIFTAGNDVRLILLYSDVAKVSATIGKNQQLTILTKGDEYASEYHNIDLQGCSYDGANYEDLQRICRLIQQNAGTV